MLTVFKSENLFSYLDFSYMKKECRVPKSHCLCMTFNIPISCVTIAIVCIRHYSWLLDVVSHEVSIDAKKEQTPERPTLIVNGRLHRTHYATIDHYATVAGMVMVRAALCRETCCGME